MEYDKLDLIDAKAEKLLEEYSSDESLGTYTNALYFIIVLFVISVCFLYVLKGYLYLLFALALVSLLAYRIIVSKAAKRTDTLALYNTFENDDKKAYTIAKLRYLGSLIKLKRARAVGLRLVYTVCFPVWLYMLSLLFIDREINAATEWMYIGLALIMGGVFWYFFFKHEIQSLSAHKDEIKSIIGHIETS